MRGGRSAGRCSFVVAAGSVAGMDVFSPNSRKVRQPGLSVGESDDHRRRMRAFHAMRRLCREKKRTARLDKSDRAVL